MSYARYGALRVLPGGMGLLVDNPGSFGALPSTDWAGQASARSFSPDATEILGAAINNSDIPSAASDAASMEQEAQRIINHPLAQSLQAKVAAAESAVNSAIEAMYQKVLDQAPTLRMTAAGIQGTKPAMVQAIGQAIGASSGAAVAAAYKAYVKNVGAQVAIVNQAIAADQSVAISAQKVAAAKNVDLTAGTLNQAASLTADTLKKTSSSQKMQAQIAVGSVMTPILIGAAVLIPVGAIAFFMLRKKGASAAKVGGYRRRTRRSRR